MIYINALELINVCVSNNVLTEKDGKIVVCRGKKGASENDVRWYLEDKDLLAKELMKSKEGQEKLIAALKEKNVDFKPKDYSWL